jgi:quercetin 2,3-dioxygenase
MSLSATTTLIRSDERRHVVAGWYDSRQSFTGPGNDHFGPLVIHNNSVIAPGQGFPLHRHEHMEIVTWVFSGLMDHADTEGNTTTIRPGISQRMSAGTGIMHTEHNSGEQPSHGVQMWVLPDEHVTPSYAQADVTADLDTGRLIPVASGAHPYAAVDLHRRDATLWAARLAPGNSVELPAGRLSHLFVGRGVVEAEAVGRMGTGDALRATGAGGLRVTGVADGTEMLIWEFA